MNVLTGINKFLEFINENWMMIFSIATLIIVTIKRAKAYFSLSVEERVKIAKTQIKEIMLRLVTEAECDYRDFIKAGSIKRAQVIDEIFTMYPILSKVTNQEDLITWVDTVIDESLKDMRGIFEENKENTESSIVEST